MNTKTIILGPICSEKLHWPRWIQRTLLLLVGAAYFIQKLARGQKLAIMEREAYNPILEA
jgi:hypothetical protein